MTATCLCFLLLYSLLFPAPGMESEWCFHFFPAEDDVAGKLLSYNRANRAVAILCNHQRSIPKTFARSMQVLQEKVRQTQLRDLRPNPGSEFYFWGGVMSEGIPLVKNIRECPGNSGLHPRGGEGWGDLKCWRKHTWHRIWVSFMSLGCFSSLSVFKPSWEPFLMSALTQLDRDQGNWFPCPFLQESSLKIA